MANVQSDAYTATGSSVYLYIEYTKTNQTGDSVTYNVKRGLYFSSYGDFARWTASIGLSDTDRPTSYTSHAINNRGRYYWASSNDYTFTRGTSSVNYVKSVGCNELLGYTSGSTNSYTRPSPFYIHCTLNVPARDKYTVTFNANGHGTAPSSQTVYYGYTATQPTAPTASGYTFGGWYTDSACTNAWSFSTAITSNKTLYAKWTPNAYTITYNGNSATSGSAPASQTVSYNNSNTLRAVPSGLLRTGFHLNSGSQWLRIINNKTRTTYAASTSYSWTTFGSLTASSTPITLYANWIADTYTVTYNANYGSGAPSNQTKTYNVPLTLSSTKPTRTGYTFSTWSASTGGTCDAGKPFSGNGSSNGATITMTAVWTANVYTMTYNANGGSGSIQPLSKPYNESKNLSDGTGFTRTGTVNGAFVEYKQTGWNTKADGTGTSYSLGQEIAANTILTGLTLYAIWEVKVIYPTITNLAVYRTATAPDGDLTPVDDGEYLVVHFNYTDCSEDGGTTTITPTCEITIDNATYTKVLSNGECYYKNSNQYSQDATHEVSVRLYDPNSGYTRSSATASIVVPTAILPIDLYGRGTSVYMGLMHVHVEGQPVTMPVTYVDNLYVDVDTDTQEAPDSSLWTAIHTNLSWF